MKISELIDHLALLQDLYGDLPVTTGPSCREISEAIVSVPTPNTDRFVWCQTEAK